MFPSAASVHYRNLWSDRVAAGATRLGEQLTAFDLAEGGQVGSVGYAARLDQLLALHVRTMGQALLETLLQVHRDFHGPLTPQAEATLLGWADDATDEAYEGAVGIGARHLGRMTRTPPRTELIAHECALAKVFVLNSLRRHFFTLRHVPGEAASAPADLGELDVVESGTGALAQLRARIARMHAQLKRPAAAAGFQGTFEAHDGSTQAYAVRGVKSPQRLHDDLETLFVWLWSMKDHLKEEFSARGWDQRDVERFVDATPNLQLVADIANKGKHSVLKTSRSGEWPELEGVNFLAPQKAIRSVQVGAASVDIEVQRPGDVEWRASLRLRSGRTLDAFEVLAAAIAEWEKGPAARLEKC